MSLNRRLFLYIFMVFFVLIGSISFFQFQREKEFRSEQLDQQLTTYNHIIDKYIQENSINWQALHDFVRVLPDSNLRVTVVKLDGNVVFDSWVAEGTVIENHKSRPELLSALQSGNGKSIRASNTVNEDLYYLAHRYDTYFIRTALPYNVSLKSMLEANMYFLYFMGFVMFLAMLALLLISNNFAKSVTRLRTFVESVESDEITDTNIVFPKDELGEISDYIVQMYKKLLRTKAAVINEREKLIKHLQISQEGLGIFSSSKKELLVNSHFVQYANILSDTDIERTDQIFSIPEFAEINEYIDASMRDKISKRKRVVIEKGSKVFMVQCMVFQDDSFEVSINDISMQENENELKRHLTQNISHELKTPVSSIMGYMESILENPNLDPERQRFFIERSFQQAHRLSALLQDISTLNKIDEAKRMYDKEPCNVSEIIEDVLNDVHLQIEQQNCTIIKNYTENILIAGNRSLLYSVFRNLLDNALAYAGDNLKIYIHCYREDDEYYYFSFTDNGQGVAEIHINRLFERFYRVDKGRSRKGGGTGLGLAIVKNAILFHKGKISAKNAPNGGLNFIFSLKKGKV